MTNYYKPGPATNPGRAAEIAEPSARRADDKGSWHVAENFVEGSPGGTFDNWSGVRGSNYIKLEQPWESMPIKQETAEAAYKSVLENAGATLPKRDSVDTRIIGEVRSGTATFEGVYDSMKGVADKSKITGIIDSQNDVGEWPELKSAPAPMDSDHDGMPDEWETTKGLDPNNADDGHKIGDDGYTILEHYPVFADSWLL